MMVNSVNGHLKGYFYKEGYIRTSSYNYSLNTLHNRMIHLTNDAVQKNSNGYGKHEIGNKVNQFNIGFF